MGKEQKMSSEYKVISDAFCITPGHKARKIEGHLNEQAKEGWKLDALDAVMLLGIDIGYYLVLKRKCES